MKRFTLLAFLLFAFVGAFAQSISVKSFQALPMDMTASSLEGKRLDQNGAVAALIKIVTTETGFAFDGGVMGIVDVKQMVGEIWVWVPYGSRKISIMHQQLGVLRDYRYPINIEAERTYEMVLTTAKIETVIKEEVRQQYLAFKVTPINATLEVNDDIWEVDADGNAQDYVPFGTYSWRVQAPNYHPDAGNVTVNDPNNTQFVTVELRPNFGWIEVDDEGALEGASVYVDNALIGKAPCKSDALKSGQHTVRIVKKMYATHSETVTVSDNETTRLTPSLDADFAEVTLEVDADAEIWVNNELKGIRTWTGPLGSGTYKMECKQANHETSLTTKEITAAMSGETITLPLPVPIYGSLMVESTPKFCKLYIDGKDMGTTPKSINEILIGQHEIKLTQEGYVDYKEIVTVAKNERKQVKVTLSSKPRSEETFTVNGMSFTMKLVEGGTFQMGVSSELENEAYDDEKPIHSVTLDNYYLGETEVTQALWEAVMGAESTSNVEWEDMYGKGDNYPAYKVSWNDVQEFIRNLNQQTGKNFRLPTEAEWEYAARGGCKSNGYKYSGSDNLGNMSWYNDNSGRKSHTVKSKAPNELGLYDMSGNVWEWCQDWYGSYGSDALTNPMGVSKGSRRVLRGGSWNYYAGDCRVSRRSSNDPDIRFSFYGFRLCLPQ